MTYLEKSPGLQQTYTVSGESLIITGKKWIGGSFRQEFALKKVKANPDEHRVRDDAKTALVGLPGFVVFLFGAITGTEIYEKTPVGFYAILGLGLAGMLVGIVLGGKIRVFVYKSTDEAPLFAVADRGKHIEFEAFTNELKAHILAAHHKEATK